MPRGIPKSGRRDRHERWRPVAAVPEDKINHPKHYNQGKFETVEIIDDICQFYHGEEGAALGHALTYLGRAPHKGEKMQDLLKAQWWVNHLIEVAQKRNGRVDQEASES